MPGLSVPIWYLMKGKLEQRIHGSVDWITYEITCRHDRSHDVRAGYLKWNYISTDLENRTPETWVFSPHRSSDKTSLGTPLISETYLEQPNPSLVTE